MREPFSGKRIRHEGNVIYLGRVYQRRAEGEDFSVRKRFCKKFLCLKTAFRLFPSSVFQIADHVSDYSVIEAVCINFSKPAVVDAFLHFPVEELLDGGVF